MILRLSIVQVLQHNEELVHLTHLEIAVPRFVVVNVEHNTQILHSLFVRLVQIHLQVFLENAESDTEKHVHQDEDADEEINDEEEAVLALYLIGRQHNVWEVGHHQKRQHVEDCVRDVWHPERALQRALEHRVTDPGEVHDVQSDKGNHREGVDDDAPVEEEVEPNRPEHEDEIDRSHRLRDPRLIVFREVWHSDGKEVDDRDERKSGLRGQLRCSLAFMSELVLEVLRSEQNQLAEERDR